MIISKGVPSELMEMITGKLLGDGNMINDGKKATRLRFSHAAKDRGWCLHCYQQLSKCMKLSPPTYRRCYDPRIKTGYTEIYYVQSFTWYPIEQIKSDWYPNGKKRVPYEYITVMSSLWYQDDGHFEKRVKMALFKKIFYLQNRFRMKNLFFFKTKFMKNTLLLLRLIKKKDLSYMINLPFFISKHRSPTLVSL